MTNLPFIFYFLLLFFVVIMPLGVSAYVVYKRRKQYREKDKRCSLKKDAICVNRYTQTEDIDGMEVVKYFTIWEFSHNNTIYQTEIRCNSSNYSEIGEKSVIRVNPYNLNESIKEMKKRNLMTMTVWVCLIISTLTIIFMLLEMLGITSWLFRF